MPKPPNGLLLHFEAKTKTFFGFLLIFLRYVKDIY